MKTLRETRQEFLAEYVEKALERHESALLSENKAREDFRAILQYIYRLRLRNFNPFIREFAKDVETDFERIPFHVGTRHYAGYIDEHHKSLKESFANGLPVDIIGGDAGTGKTLLMRRFAYDWATMRELQQYNLVFLVAFRNVRGKKFDTILELVTEGMQWTGISPQKLPRLIKEHCTMDSNHANRHLVLLDGYDEAVPSDPCMELEILLRKRQETVAASPLFDIVLTKRNIDTAPQADNLQEILKFVYRNGLSKINPLNQDYTFEIETDFVQLSFKTISHAFRSSEKKEQFDDHCKLLSGAFSKERQILLIEGAAATGKTSLMRRIAYDWAKYERQKSLLTNRIADDWAKYEKLGQYHLVFIMEFRDVQGKKFKSLQELVLEGMKWTKIEQHLMIEEFKKYSSMNVGPRSMLLLLDGYDEAMPRSPCQELEDIFNNNGLIAPICFDIIVTTRPAYLTAYLTNCARLNSVEVLGFITDEQKEKFIKIHFDREKKSGSQSGIQSALKRIAVLGRLNKHSGLLKCAETPLLLLFICLVYERLTSGSVFELYFHTIWWLIDRYQKSHPSQDIPSVCRYQERDNTCRKHITIQDHFIKFPLLRNLGRMAFEKFDANRFGKRKLQRYQLYSNNDVEESLEIPKCPSTKIGLLNEEERKSEGRFEKYAVFPHRTIQEFLAGGVFYFWPEIKKLEAKNPDLCAALFASKEYDSRRVGEMEKFLWQAFFVRVRPEMEPHLKFRKKNVFERYKALQLDLSIIEGETMKLLPVLNECLSKCCNVTELSLNAPHVLPMIIPNAIILDAMKSLRILTLSELYFEEAIPISRAKVRTPLSSFKLENSGTTYITLKECTFLTAECFKETLKYLSDTNYNTKLALIDCTVQVNNSSAIENIHVDKQWVYDYLSSEIRPNEISTLATYLGNATQMSFKFSPDQEIYFGSCSKLSKLVFHGYHFTSLKRIYFPKFKACAITWHRCKFDSIKCFAKSIKELQTDESTSLQLIAINIAQNEKDDIVLIIDEQPLSNFLNSHNYVGHLSDSQVCNLEEAFREIS